MAEQKSNKMRAIVYEALGAPEKNIKLTEVDIPAPKQGEVQIRVKAASVNPIDWKISEGHVPFPVQLPRIQGFDVAGIVSAVGAGVDNFKVGDEVYGDGSIPSTGSFADFDVVPSFTIAKKPQSLSFEEAASVPLAFLTAYQSLVDHGGLKAGQKVLVLGGSGGVGSAGVQIAKALNAWVAATTSSANVNLVQSFGTDVVIDYKNKKWEEELHGQNIYVVFDSVGEAKGFERAQRVLKKGGIFVSCAQWGDKSTEDFKAVGMMLDVKKGTEQLNILTPWIDQGKLKVLVEKTYPFSQEEVINALNYSKSGRTKGKLAISVQ